MSNLPTLYRGRFAPSPTGPLHFGSLISAVVSYLDARAAQGTWLVRIEDIDPPREISGSDTTILETLELFGFEWDEEIIWQSKRSDYYHEAITQLAANSHIYSCSCTRKAIIAAGLQGANGMLYPGICRERNLPYRERQAIRLRVNNTTVCFNDRACGEYCQNLSRDVGDFIIQRSDQLWAYQLAVIVDDANQNITHVVRGQDLLSSTPRQIYLQQCLSYSTPQYLHHTLIVDKDNIKLSKQTGARPLNTDNPVRSLFECLVILNQQPPPDLRSTSLTDLWQWAIKHWDVSALSG